MGLAHGDQIFTAHHIGWVGAAGERRGINGLCYGLRFLPKQPLKAWESEGFRPEYSALSSSLIETIDSISKGQIKVIFPRAGSE